MSSAPQRGVYYVVEISCESAHNLGFCENVESAKERACEVLREHGKEDTGYRLTVCVDLPRMIVRRRLEVVEG